MNVAKWFWWTGQQALAMLNRLGKELVQFELSHRLVAIRVLVAQKPTNVNCAGSWLWFPKPKLVKAAGVGVGGP